MSTHKGKLIVVLACVLVLAAGNVSQVSSSGGPLGQWFPISLITNESGHYAEEYPSVAYNSFQQEYLVVWQQADSSGNTAIYGRRVSRSGALVGSVLLISPPYGVNRYPDVAYDGAHNNYLVVYEVEGAGIYGQRVGGDGGLVGSEFCIVSEIGYALHEPAIAYATTAGQYLVTWQRVQGVWQGIAARTVPGTGITPGSVLDITGLLTVELLHPDVAYNSARDQFLVVWQQWWDSTYRYDIRGQRIDMDGGAHLEDGIIDILFSMDDEVFPAVGAVAQPADVGKYLVVCERYYPEGSTIDGQLVTGNGTLDPYVRISPSFDSYIPAVAGNEATQGYLVAWLQGLWETEIQAREVSVWGYVVGVPRSLPGQVPSHPAVAGGPLGDYLVADDAWYSLAYPYDVFGYLWGNRLFLPLVLQNH